MIHEGFMSLVVRPLEPFMIHARFALRLQGGQTPMYHKYTLAMLGGLAVNFNTCYDTCSPTPPLASPVIGGLSSVTVLGFQIGVMYHTSHV